MGKLLGHDVFSIFIIKRASGNPVLEFLFLSFICMADALICDQNRKLESSLLQCTTLYVLSQSTIFCVSKCNCSDFT